MMMKKVLIIVIAFAFIGLSANAQPWAQVGATWYYTAHWAFFVPFDGYDKFEKIGDTLVGGKLCDNIYETIYGYNYWLNMFTTGHDNWFTYESNDTVYFWVNNSQFKIFAIYSAQVGDTWLIDGSDTIHCGDSSYFKVDSLGQRIIGMDTLSIQYLTAHHWQDGPPMISPITLTKSLGYNATMFPHTSCSTDGFQWGPFRCYHDSSGLYYNSGMVFQCDSTVGIKEPMSTPLQISLYPNPTFGTFTLSYHLSTPDAAFQLLDISGRVVYKHSISGTTGKELIDASALSNGMYFYQLTSASESWQGKVVVEK